MNHHIAISLITIAIINDHMIGIELKKPEESIGMGAIVADTPARNSKLEGLDDGLQCGNRLSQYRYGYLGW